MSRVACASVKAITDFYNDVQQFQSETENERGYIFSAIESFYNECQDKRSAIERLIGETDGLISFGEKALKTALEEQKRAKETAAHAPKELKIVSVDGEGKKTVKTKPNPAYAQAVAAARSADAKVSETRSLISEAKALKDGFSSKKSIIVSAMSELGNIENQLSGAFRNLAEFNGRAAHTLQRALSAIDDYLSVRIR